jgi:hypothetical protein
MISQKKKARQLLTVRRVSVFKVTFAKLWWAENAASNPLFIGMGSSPAHELNAD